MDLNYSQEESAFRDEVRGWLKANLPAGPARQDRQLRRARPRRPAALAQDPRQEGLGRARLAEGVGRHRLERGAALHLRGGVRLRRHAAADPVRPVDVRARCCCASAPRRRRSASCRASTRARTSGARAIPSRARAPTSRRSRPSERVRTKRRPLRRQRPEDLDHARPLRRLDLLPRAHRFQPAKRQEGISFLLIDMKTPGITVRPLILMDGGHEVNEVFFDDVKVPVGEPRARGGQGLDGGEVPARPRAHEHRPHRRLQARARQAEGVRGRAEGRRRPAADRGPALPRPADARRGRADGARDHQPALPRPACAAAASRRAPTSRC